MNEELDEKVGAKIIKSDAKRTWGGARPNTGNIVQRRAEEYCEVAPFAGAANVILAALDDADVDGEGCVRRTLVLANGLSWNMNQVVGRNSPSETPC